MEDLNLGRIAALVPEFAVKDLPLGRTLMMMMIRTIFTIVVLEFSKKNISHKNLQINSFFFSVNLLPMYDILYTSRNLQHKHL